MDNNLKPQAAFYLITWFLLIIFGRSIFLADPGTFSHIIIGEKILSHGRLIYEDPFSFTFFGRPWIAQQWLGECLMALVFRWGQLDALLVITVTLLTSLYTWLFHRLTRRGIHPLVSLIFITFVLTASLHHFLIRPHLLTTVFMAVLVALLSDFESGRIPISRLFWAIPLFILWSNLHGGALGGIATLAITGTGWLVLKAFKKETPLKNQQGLTMVILVLAGCLTPLINPYGLELPRTWLSIMRSSMITEKIQEHQPLLSFQYWWIVLPCIALYFISFLSTLYRFPRVTWLIPLIWFFLSLSRVRHTTLFAVSVAVAAGEMFPYMRWVQWLSRKGSKFFSLQTKARPWNRKPIIIFLLMISALLIIPFFFQSKGLEVPVLGKGWARLDPTHWPLEILPELKRIENTHGEGTPIFNEDLFGGFLIFFTPKLRVFIDDRFELYGDDFMKMVGEAEEKNPDRIEVWANKYGFNYGLTIRNSSFDNYLSSSPYWRLMKESKAGSLFQRKKGG
jgi:hypothetical protein